MSVWVIAAGFAAGVLASMGMGGGTVLLLYLRLFTETDQITAQGMNLIFFVPSAVLSIIIYQKKKLIKFEKILPVIIVGAAGAVAGAVICIFINPDIIGKGFAVLLIFMGLKELFSAIKTR